MQRYFDSINEYEKVNGHKPKLILISTAEFKRMAQQAGMVSPVNIAFDDVPAVASDAIIPGECVLIPFIQELPFYEATLNINGPVGKSLKNFEKGNNPRRR